MLCNIDSEFLNSFGRETFWATDSLQAETAMIENINSTK